MAKIFISTSRDGSEIEALLIRHLMEEHELIRLDAQPGYEWRDSIKKAISRADVFLVVVTEKFMHSKYGLEELRFILSYVENNNKKLFVPIVVGEIEVPFDIAQFRYISLDPREPASVQKAVLAINNSIASHAGRIAASSEIESKKKEKIETKATEYVEEAIKELKEREINLLGKAGFWYWMGYGAIGVGVISAGIFAFVGYSRFQETSPAWDLVSFTAIKSIVLVGLLLAMAKYSFSLAKSYMEESLKNADRIHAISFGKFYLQAFGNDAQQGDIKEVFQHWNISGKNSFSAQNADAIEPKILEAAFELAKAMSAKDKKP